MGFGVGRSPVRFTIAVALFVVVSFLAATAQTQRQAAEIDALAATISMNAAPAIEELTRARGEIGAIELQFRAASLAAMEKRPFDRRALDASQLRLRAALEAYLSYPFFPAEREVYLAAAERIAKFQAAVEEAMARIGSTGPGNPWKEPSALRSVTWQADAALSALISFNANETNGSATRIRDSRRRATRTAWALNTIVAALAAVLFGMAYWISRRYAAIVIERDRLAAERAITAREDLLAIVSHDLKSPLHSISIGVDVLDRASGFPDAAKVVSQVAEAIRHSTDRMGRMISDLLLAAKAEAGRMVLEPRDESVERIFSDVRAAFLPLAEERHLALHLGAVPPGLPVFCDRQRVLQIFSNLIGNAIEFTPPGGRIDIDVQPGRAEVVFAVADSGPGIPAADLAHIFDRYWQRRETARRGTGLGLFIAKGLVEGHSGRIWCESRIGKGSTFYFSLPHAAPPSEALATTAATDGAARDQPAPRMPAER